jgi:hypothetical protein
VQMFVVHNINIYNPRVSSAGVVSLRLTSASCGRCASPGRNLRKPCREKASIESAWCGFGINGRAGNGERVAVHCPRAPYSTRPPVAVATGSTVISLWRLSTCTVLSQNVERPRLNKSKDRGKMRSVLDKGCIVGTHRTAEIEQI